MGRKRFDEFQSAPRCDLGRRVGCRSIRQPADGDRLSERRVDEPLRIELERSGPIETEILGDFGGRCSDAAPCRLVDSEDQTVDLGCDGRGELHAAATKSVSQVWMTASDELRFQWSQEN